MASQWLAKRPFERSIMLGWGRTSIPSICLSPNVGITLELTA
jgi:hypothetical protein